MGILGGDTLVKNQTSYKWTFCVKVVMPPLFPDQYSEQCHLYGYGEKKVRHLVPVTMFKDFYMCVKYGHCSKETCCNDPDLWYIFNPKDDPVFTIEESGDQSEVLLKCNINYDNKRSSCPNYGRIEDDIRQQEERQKEKTAEEENRQRQRERERRIEEQIQMESKMLAQRLSQANEELRQQAKLRSQNFHQQAHIMQALDIHEIGRDEEAEMAKKFSDLMEEYELEDENPEDSLADRVKTLQDELVVDYCKDHGLTSSCLFLFDRMVDYETLPLTNRLSVLEAVLCLIFYGIEEDHTLKSDRDFLLWILKLIHNTNPTLAWKLLQNMLCTDTQISQCRKEILSLMVFNNVWKPSQITKFLRLVSDKNEKLVESVLQLVQTYKLEYRMVSPLLDKPDLLDLLRISVDNEKPKGAKAILQEMCEANYPENIITVLKDVLECLEVELPKHQDTNLGKNEIRSVKVKVKQLDFSNPDKCLLKEILILMSVAVKECTTIRNENGEKIIEGYLPRLTQLASLVIFLMPNRKQSERTGCLLEIGTGEGKSCILAMLTAIHSMCGVKVDLVTSSPVLARRDLEEWKALYDMFGITSSVVPPPFDNSTPEEQEERIRDAYKQQIVYSTVETFAADVLEQEFEKKTTRGTRDFELVLVDEVDYMTLDNGVQITFLSHESSGLQHLEQVLASIWLVTSACRPIKVESENEEVMWTTRVQNFHMAALQAAGCSESSNTFSPLEVLEPGIALGFYSEEEFEALKNSLSADVGEKEHVNLENEAWNNLMAKLGVEQQYDLLTVIEIAMDNKLAFNCHVYDPETGRASPFGEAKQQTDLNVNMLLLENGKACELMSEKLLVEATVSEIRSKIKYSRQVVNKTDVDADTLVIPSFLKEYLEKQLPVFVANALKAIQMTKGREYMIERSLRAQGLDINEEDQYQYHSIIPVDFQASGMLEKRKRWGDGLQQFLEMKHQLALSPISNVTNYLSNLSFFRRYLKGKGILGVSGTLGGEADKGFLKRHYETDCYVIPAHKRKKITELPAVQVRGGTEMWLNELHSAISEACKRGQVVLVVCEDVNMSNALKDKITPGTKHPVTMYTMSESHNIENRVFEKGEIIIATSLGGRGTDVKVSKEVNRCGGLFVILTYFPNNRRVEKQVFGRTGRKGTPGMVQLILNHDHLPLAYHGQSVEVMREVREEFEISRIREMEKERLAEIQMKEELFSTFCTFLSDFGQHYSKEEKIDLLEVEVRNVHHSFKKFNTKMDYHPALNALKDFWGIWLVLHADQINVKSDVNQLKQELTGDLQKECGKLLQGDSLNFYDHVQQALGRTALHFKSKGKCDYGSKAYWEIISDLHKYYRAVALYNQAYITISIAQKNYKEEACSLLEEAEEAIDVYVSETSNTLNLCSLSISKDFEPHHSGCCNFHIQMQARMNLFNSWKRNIEEILHVLKSAEGDVKIVDSTLHSLSGGQDFVSTNELGLLRSYGLVVVFNVKMKPRFSYDALICCFLGLAQVAAGVLICALSSGTLASFGLSLISEGVSDMVSGIMGMINGTFSWASWAISKAISIGISLVFGGFKAIKKAYSSVKDAASSILNGTKSLNKVACKALQSGKQVFKSAWKFTKSVRLQNVGALFTKEAVKLNLKHATKYAVQELAIQTGNTLLNQFIDDKIQELFIKTFKSIFQKTVHSALCENEAFSEKLTEIIVSSIPETALEEGADNYKIDMNLEMKIKEYIASKNDVVINKLIVNCKEVHLTVSALSQVWAISAEHVPQQYHLYITGGLKAVSFAATISEAISSVPTKNTIDRKFVPAFLESMNNGPLLGQGGRDRNRKLQEVERLKNEIIYLVSEDLSQTMIQAFSGLSTSLLTKTFSHTLNCTTGKVIGNLLGRKDTQDFFTAQQHCNNLKSSGERKKNILSEKELLEVEQYASKITDENEPATSLEMKALTKCGYLNGKGVCITVEDETGKVLREETYTGTDPEAGNISLRLTNTPVQSSSETGFFEKFKNRVWGKSVPHTGHIRIEVGGQTIHVNSENQNCFYHAVIQAETNEPDEVVKQKVGDLRLAVKDEIMNNKEIYARDVKIQNMFNMQNSSNKYKTEAGYRLSDNMNFAYQNKNLSDKQIVQKYGLGDVGSYANLCENKESPVVEADHVPPKHTYKMLRRHFIKNDPAEMRAKYGNLYDMVMKDPEGKDMICINTLVCDHRNALTSGPSTESRVCRKLLTQAWKEGDFESALKLSMMAAHPGVAKSLRESCDITRPPAIQEFERKLSDEARDDYYRKGFQSIVNANRQMGIINQNQAQDLKDWINSGVMFTDRIRNTEEFKKIKENVKYELNKRKTNENSQFFKHSFLLKK